MQVKRRSCCPIKSVQKRTIVLGLLNMKTLLLAVIAFLMSANVALGCICDLECPEGETYSDEAEMCVADNVPTS